MTYTPKVGDIVNVKAKVLYPLTPGGRTELRVIGDAHTLYGTHGGITIEPQHLTLVERPKRELKPGDRIRHKRTGNEYIYYTENRWCESVGRDVGRIYHRDSELTPSFDTWPDDWDYFPRNETPE